jgi:hypothetical protein
MKVLLLHPGASWSTADVEAGLRYGLQQHGVEVVRYRLDARLERSKSWLFGNWRHAKKTNPSIPRPNVADVAYQAGIGALEMALRQQVDHVLIVSAMFTHPDVVIMMRRAGLRVSALFTESPYDDEKERQFAGIVNACWTNERSVVDSFRAVNPHTWYLPHAWHPERHTVDPDAGDVPSHDVVFVGSGFSERVKWFNAIDWRGIDLGLYGTWKGFGINAQVRRAVRAGNVDNTKAAALYRRAKVGLNLYRTTKGLMLSPNAARISHAESLSPRAYELAACGVFHLSEDRAEVREVFGDLVPTFRTPTEAAALIRAWLADEAGRARIAAQLPARVAESSWVARASQVIGNLQSLSAFKAA